MRAQPPASHFVDGKPMEDTAGEPFDVIHSADGSVIARLHMATPAVIEAAIASAARAQQDWADWQPVARGRVLRRAADIMRERNRELSELETLDTGKPLSETLVADAASGADALEYFGGLAGTINGETIPLGRDMAFTRRAPLGVCVGIGAWNYPIQIASWKAAPALICGNALVFKPSEATPLTVLKLAEIFIEAGAPPGLFNVVQGAGAVGAALVTHPRVAKVSLTGSVATGRKVYAAAAQGVRHVTMELGGKSPILVFEDADLDDAVGGAMLGNFYSAGQICSNGTRVFVQRAVLGDFLTRLTARTEAIRIGDPMDEATQMGPLISLAHRDSVLEHIRRGVDQGARLVTGGGVPDGFANGAYLSPTVFADVTDDMALAREEIFGPVMSVLVFDDEDEALARANSLPVGLAAGVFTRDITRAHRVAGKLEAGITWINAYNLTPVEAPFGGVKMSGVGRENGRAALEHWSEIRTVFVNLGPVDSPF
jgi:betaine-aldehyde dehydrogenase